MPTLSVGTHNNEHFTPQHKQGGDRHLGAAADEALIDGGLCQLLGRHRFRGTLQHLRTSYIQADTTGQFPRLYLETQTAQHYTVQCHRKVMALVS